MKGRVEPDTAPRTMEHASCNTSEKRNDYARGTIADRIRGKCSAAMRSFEARVKWLPSINEMIVQISEAEEDCYDSSKEAVAAAKHFRDDARAKLHDEYRQSSCL